RCVRADSQDARVEHPRQARLHRPHAGRRVRGRARARRPQGLVLIPDGGGAPPGVGSGSCPRTPPSPSSPAPPAGPGSPPPDPPARGYRLALAARGADALEQARAEPAARTTVAAPPGDVAAPAHREALAAAAGDRIDLLVNNASLLGPSPQPPLHAYPLDELE